MSLRAANIKRQSAHYFGALAAAEQAAADLLQLSPKQQKRAALRAAKKAQSLINQRADKKQAKKYLQISKPALSPAQAEQAAALDRAAKDIYQSSELYAERSAAQAAAKLNFLAERRAKASAQAAAEQAAKALKAEQAAALAAELAAIYLYEGLI